MASFPGRDHSPQCGVVLSVSLVLPRFGGNDAGGGLEVEHSTINRWILKYAPELDKRIGPHLQSTNDSWRVDETYIKVKERWKYLYWAVDSEEDTLDFLMRARRDASAAERFLRKTLNASHTQSSRVINVDKNVAYPAAVDDLKAKEQLPETTELRQVKHLNNRVEQYHRFSKRLTLSGMRFGSFNTARRTLKGFEVMNMIRKRHFSWCCKRRCPSINRIGVSTFWNCPITSRD